MANEEEKAIARDFVLARLGICRGAISMAASTLDDVLQLFVTPDEDREGTERTVGLDLIDDALGEAARAVQAAQELIDDIDFAAGEPDLPEGDGDDEAEDADDD